MSDQLPPRPPPGQDAKGVRPVVLIRKGLYTALGVLVVAAATLAVYAARDILIWALIALFLAISLDTIVRLLTRWRMPRGLAVFAVILVSLVLVAGFLSAVIPTMVEQFQAMVKVLPAHVANWQDRSAGLRKLGQTLHLTARVDSVVNGLPGRVGNGLFGATGRLLSGLSSALTVAVLTVYFLADLPRLRQGAASLCPRAYRDQVGRIVDVMVDKVGAYTIGNIGVSVIAGAAAFAALTALRIPLALPLAFLVAVTDLIPSVGAALGAGVCLLVALPTKPLWPNVVVLALFFVLYQLLENYLFAPRIMHGTVQLPPGAVLMATLIGATALGLVGALMAIPIAAGVQVLVSERLLARDSDNRPPQPGGEELDEPDA